MIHWNIAQITLFFSFQQDHFQGIIKWSKSFNNFLRNIIITTNKLKQKYQKIITNRYIFQEHADNSYSGHHNQLIMIQEQMNNTAD